MLRLVWLVFYFRLLTNYYFLAPKIIVFNSNANAFLHSNIVLICTLQSGSKPVEFAWKKFNDQLLPNVGKIQIDHHAEVSTLSIQNVSNYDSGDYSCIARNTFGTDRFNLPVTIKGYFCCDYCHTSRPIQMTWQFESPTKCGALYHSKRGFAILGICLFMLHFPWQWISLTVLVSLFQNEFLFGVFLCHFVSKFRCFCLKRYFYLKQLAFIWSIYLS